MALPEAYHSLRWRLVGPFRGGRAVTAAGDPNRRLVFYFGSCAGGVWKTVDAGITWQNVSDGYFGSASIGAIAVAPSDPNVIYVGTGEAHIRGNVVAGDGVYKSTDAGRTWTKIGLGDTRHIGRIRVHPTNPDVVYVAALGHAFGPNQERGVFRTSDGGRSWDRVLYRDEDTGAVDLAMDVTNPRVLYASLWQTRRGPHFLSSGGPGSGIFKSTDGGDTWTELSDAPGMAKGVKGKIGLAVSPARPDRVWAVVEAAEGGLFRSDDGGATWSLVNDNPELKARAFYYMHIFADPQNAEKMYVLNLGMFRTSDGGKTFARMITPHGDNHDLWIDPADPDRMIQANDGGANVTFDGGLSWSTIYNQATAQFYHVTTDNAFPYRVYGAQQDNSTMSVPSRTDEAGIALREWFDVGGAESGFIEVRPDDPNVIYAGSSGGGEGGRITRYDHRLRERRDISPWPQRTAGRASEEYKYRFQWTSPIHISPHDMNTLYVCGNRVFKTTNDGESWDLISADLTRNDPSRLGPSGGPINKDHTGVEVYCTIFAFAESAKARDLLWAGSDDGLIHISKDGGHSWDNVTPPASLLPEWALISLIEPSPHDPATAYVAATRYKLDDLKPYLLKTSDYGKTWQAINVDLPAEDFTRAIREDPVKKGLLYCGTESGVYVSFNDGGAWHRLNLNLPLTPIHDLVIKDDDLVVATHGRSFWILDDVSPLREDVPQAAIHLFPPRTTVRFRSNARGGMMAPADVSLEHPIVTRVFPGGGTNYLTKRASDQAAAEFADAGQNPPPGVILNYVLAKEPEGELALTVKDSAGQVVRTETGLPKSAGANRFVWNMHAAGATKLEETGVSERWARLGAEGPMVPPGNYLVELSSSLGTVAQPVRLVPDPRIRATQDDLEAQYRLSVEIRDKLGAAHAAVNRIRSLRGQVDTWCQKAEGHPLKGRLEERAQPVRDKLAAVEGSLVQVNRGKNAHPIGLTPKLNDELAHLLQVVGSADWRPNKQSRALFEETATAVDADLKQFDDIVNNDLRAFEGFLMEMALPAIQ